MQPATAYPLLFDCKVKLFDSIDLRIQGQAVVTIEDDGDGPYHLAHGLHPGGISGIGATLQEAYRDMERTMLLVLAEMAVIADTEDAFQADARQFFYHNTSEWAVTNFEAARKAVAAGEVESNLKRKQSIYSLDISGWREEVHTSTPDSTKTEPSQPTELAAAA